VSAPGGFDFLRQEVVSNASTAEEAGAGQRLGKRFRLVGKEPTLIPVNDKTRKVPGPESLNGISKQVSSSLAGTLMSVSFVILGKHALG
jgi:hypothetical protein